eukprot:gene20953-27806_t
MGAKREVARGQEAYPSRSILLLLLILLLQACDALLTPRVVPENRVTPRAVPENMVTPRAVPENMVTPRAVPENKVTPRAVPENKVTPRAVPENKVTLRAVPENKVTPRAVPENKAALLGGLTPNKAPLKYPPLPKCAWNTNAPDLKLMKEGWTSIHQSVCPTLSSGPFERPYFNISHSPPFLFCWINKNSCTKAVKHVEGF